MRTKPKFKFPIRWLKGYARLFQGAFTDDQVGPEILAHLAETFPTDFDSQLKLLSTVGESQSQARGRIGALTQAQGDALEDVVLLSASARRAAKVRFQGNEAILHGEFFVGQRQPTDLESVIDRAGKLLASCKEHAEDLAADGWSAQQTQALETALGKLTEAKDSQDVASDAKQGFTAQQINAANGLYRMCCALQTIARVVYSEKRAKTDPTVVNARARFLLGEFPPRTRATPSLPEEPPTGGTTSGGPAPSGPASGS